MNRAQKIRQKRLKEREIINEERRKEVMAEAKKLFDWVLDLLEHPTPNNTADEVMLLYVKNDKIAIGNEKEGCTEKTFDSEVMKKLAELFNVEDGYTGKIIPRPGIGTDSVRIRIE